MVLEFSAEILYFLLKSDKVLVCFGYFIDFLLEIDQFIESIVFYCDIKSPFHKFRDFLKFLLLTPSSGHSRSAKSQPTGFHSTQVPSYSIFIRRYVKTIKNMLISTTINTKLLQTHQHNMIISTTSNYIEAQFTQLVSEFLGIL